MKGIIARVKRGLLGHTLKMVTFEYTGPTSYPTGGDPIFFRQKTGLSNVQCVLFESQPTYEVVWDAVNRKAYWAARAGGAQVGNGTDLSAYVTHGVAFGY